MQTAPAPIPSEVPVDSLLLDRYVPRFDVRIAAHTIVDADPSTTWDALLHLDLMRVHTPLMDLAFWARGLPAKVRRREEPPPPRLVLGEAEHGLPGWLELGCEPGHELVLGAVGRFWTPSIVWHDVPADRFAAFAAPGWGKIGVSFSVRPYGEGRSLLSYECRTLTTDPRSRTRFARYWRLISPFVGHIMRATVATVARDACPPVLVP
jgi:hypothetical protein